MLSVQVGIDQLVQCWDGYACKQSKKVLAIPSDIRYYLCLTLFEGCGMAQRKGDEDAGQTEYWDLTDDLPKWWRGPNLNRIRRIIDDFKTDITDRQIFIYTRAFAAGFARQEIMKECVERVSLVIGVIANGDAEVVGWDKLGRLELSTSSGCPEDEVFCSNIGLFETKDLIQKRI